MKWSEVTEHPAFKSRSAAEQEATREEYFREVVAPKFAPDQLPAVRQQFDADTRIRKQDLPAGVAPSTRGTGLATAFEQADPRRTDVADPSKTFGQGQGQGLAGVMSDIRGNEAARTQRLTTFKGASGDTYTDPTAPSTTPEGASVLDQPPPQGLAFVDASRMQRDLKKRADAAMQTRMAGAKIGPATPDQVQAMDLNEAGAGPVNRGARAGFAQMGQIGLGAMRLAGDLVGSDTVSGIAAAGGKAAGAFEQGAMQGLEGGEKLAAQVTSSIMNSMPALAMGVAGGPALRTLFAQSTLSEYNAGRDAGFSVTDSLGRAGIMGFGEALGEKFGLSEQIKLIKSITKGLPQGELAKVVGSLITKEIPGEQLTTAIQFMADKIGPAALKPNATLADYLEAAADTLKVTVGQMAVMGGGPAAINAARNTYAQANQAAQAPESAIAREMNDAAARYAKFFAPAPEEAAAPTQARASSIKRFDEAAAAWGLNPKAAAAVREQAGTKPADDVPGFLARAMAALNKRGMYAKPVDDASVAALDARLRGQAGEPPAAAPAAPMAEPVQQAPQAAAAAPASPEGDFTGLDTPSTPQAGPAPADAPIAGEQINRNWTAFAPESGTLSIPREQMPQISAEHRGALVQFLKSRGIEHQAEEVDAASLKPTQAEFSPKKVQAATDFTGGNRSILVSADGYILDGTHQWLSAREAGRPVKTIRLNAPIQDLLRLAHQFPSSTTAAGPRKAADGNQPDLAVPAPVAAGAADSGADQPGGSGGNVGPLADAGSGTPPAAAAPVAGGADPVPAGNGAQRDAALNDLQAGLQQLGGLLKPQATAPATDPTGELSAPEGVRTPPEAVAPQDLKPAAGMTFAMDGKRYTVKKAYDTAVSIEDEAGKVRNISRISEVWPKMLKAMAAEAPASRETKDAAAPAQQAPAQARVPDAAAPASAQVSAPEIPVSETDKGKPAQAKPKVYKTRAGAKAAKAGNTQRLKKVQGGYILRQATDKEMEAADKAGKRLAGGGGVDVERDSLLQAIAKLGGISLNERSDTIGEGNRNIGGKMLFTSAGRPLDELARNTLLELGYVPKGEVEADGGVRWLRDAIKSEFMGTAKHHSEQGSAWMEDRAGKSSADMTDAEYEAQRAAYEAEQAVDDGSDWANGVDSLADFTPDDLQEAGYTGLSPVEQAEVEQLLAEAESLGIDTEALREDAARATAEESADAYHAEVKALLREAIAAARAAAAGADAAAARERGPGDGQPAGDQGQEGADQGLKRPPAAEGDRIRFTGKDGTVIDGMAVQVLDTSGGNYRIKIRTDEPAPQGGGNISRTVYSQDGTFEPLADEPLLSMQSEADLRAKAEREEAARRAAGDEQRRLAAAEDKRKRDLERAEKDRRAAEILAEREAAKKAEIDAAAESFELGQEPPKPVDRKVSTEQVVGQRSVFDEPAAPAAIPAASAQQVPDDGPTPNYKAGDRITPDKDVMEGDVVKYRGAEWMAKVKRGIGIPLLPMVDGKPQVSADTKKLVDVKANEVIHTGTNVYGYGGQPKPSEKPETPAESKAIPKPVQDRVRIALQSLRGIEELLSNIQRARGNGHILALEWKDQQENMAGPLAKIAEFRALAGRNGIDAESVIEKLGGEPDLERFNVTPAAAPAPASAPVGDMFGAKVEDVAIAKRDLEAQRRALVDLEDRMVGMAGLRPGMLEDALRSRKVPKALKDQRDAIREDMTRLREQIDRMEVPVRDMGQYIKVAADSIEQLRKTDVYRVLVESNRAEFRADIATYIKANRPDLAAEVDEVMAEQARGETQPAATPAEDEAPTFTEAQARKQFEWRDLGQKDGTKTHGLFFYLKPEDKGTGRAMGRGQVTRYDGSNGWQVDSEGQKYPALADAKKAAIDAAIPTLREQGWIEGEATPAAAPTTERPTELIELRKRLSVLEALRKCIAS